MPPVPSKQTTTVTTNQGGTSTTRTSKQTPQAKQQQELMKRVQAAIDALLRGQGNPSLWLRQARALYPQQAGSFLTPQAMRQQATASMNAILQPQLKSIEDIYSRRAKAGSDAISSYYGAHSGRLSDIASDLFNRGSAVVNQQQEANAGLANFIRDRGQTLAGSLQNDLTPLNLSAGQLDAMSGAADRLATGSSNFVGSLGAIGTDRMRGQLLADTRYLGQLPGFGLQEGGEQVGIFQRQINDQMGEELSRVRGSMGEIAETLYQNLYANDLARRQLSSQRSGELLDFFGAQGNLNLGMLSAALGGYGNLLDYYTVANQNAPSTTVTTDFPSTTTSTTIEPDQVSTEAQQRFYDSWAGLRDKLRADDPAGWFSARRGADGNVLQAPRVYRNPKKAREYLARELQRMAKAAGYRLGGKETKTIISEWFADQKWPFYTPISPNPDVVNDAPPPFSSFSPDFSLIPGG